MEKFNCILVVDNDISSIFLIRHQLSEMDIAQSIRIEKNTIYAMDFIQQFSSSNGNLSPELIIMNSGLAERIEFLNLFKRLSISNKKPVRIIASTPMQILGSFNIEEENYFITFLNKNQLLTKLNTLLVHNELNECI